MSQWVDPSWAQAPWTHASFAQLPWLQAPWAHAAALLGLALFIDVVFGEYPSFLHPVVWMGKLVGLLERAAPPKGIVVPFVYGAVMALGVPSLFAFGAWALLRAVPPVPILTLVVEALLLKATFAVSALGRAAFVVRNALRRGAIDEARTGLRSLCSRDARHLNSEQLTASTIESVAENASDSFVAPLFFFALFGIPGAIFYRAVNTLDAMIGYHGKYEYLGKVSARLDDLLNLVPARITAFFFLLAGPFVGANAANGLRVLIRDGGATESPNAGRPMAAMAGLLRILLVKPGQYSLGDGFRPVKTRLITVAWRIVTLAVALVSVTFVAILGAAHGAFD